MSRDVLALKEQIETQAANYQRLAAENARLQNENRRLRRGQADLRAMLSPAQDPKTADDWAALVSRAMREIEAEHDED